jgi:hypothetical protein
LARIAVISAGSCWPPNSQYAADFGVSEYAADFGVSEYAADFGVFLRAP